VPPALNSSEKSWPSRDQPSLSKAVRIAEGVGGGGGGGGGGGSRIVTTVIKFLARGGPKETGHSIEMEIETSTETHARKCEGSSA
jgi:hypothetical protein